MSRSNTPRLGDPNLVAEAQALFNAADYAAALPAFRRLAARHPADPRVLLACAQAHGLRFEYAKARRYLNAVLAHAETMPAIFQSAGEVYRAIRLLPEALACFREAAWRAPTLATWLELSALQERTHDLDGAADSVGRGLALQPDEPSLRTLQARLARRRGDLAGCEAGLRDVLRLRHRSHHTRGRALGELAELYDARGEYAQAWQTIETCKAEQRAHEGPDLAMAGAINARFAQLFDGLDPATLQRWRGNRASSGPVLLTGFPRSGTTLLDVNLARHPNLAVVEEIGLFARRTLPGMTLAHAPDHPLIEVLGQAADARLAELARDYLRCMDEYLGGVAKRRLIDKNPANNLLIPAYARVFPGVRFVIALRDPRDVLLSCYLRYLPLNPVSVNFLTLDRLVSRYRLDMSSWLKVAPWLGDASTSVRYEDLVGDPQATLQGLGAFLGVQWDDAAAEAHAGRRHFVETPSYEQVSAPVHTRAIGRWRNYATQLAPLLDTLGDFPARLGYPS